MQNLAKVLLGMIAIGIAIVVIIGLSWMGTYNSHARNDQNVKKSWSDVESDMKRRADLIPNLVSVVKGYAAHEKETFAAVTEARSKMGQINVAEALKDPAAMKALMGASGELSGALSRLMVVAEAYPELKADQGFLKLQSQLEGTENRINVSRKRFNESVEKKNGAIVTAWGGLVAGVHGFEVANYFETTEADLETPQVSFE